MKIGQLYVVTTVAVFGSVYFAKQSVSLRQEVASLELAGRQNSTKLEECSTAVRAADTWLRSPDPGKQLSDADIVAMLRRDFPDHAKRCLTGP